LEQSRLDQDMSVTQLQVKLAEARLGAAERQQKVGAASDLDVMKAQVERKQVQLQLQQLIEQLRRLRRAGPDSTSGN
jgi:outer membrane protein TolC